MKIDSISPTDHEDISRKIHAMLDLAKQTTPEEAAAASAMVQKWLFNHQLQIEDLVPKADTTRKRKTYKKEKMKVGVKSEDRRQWKVDLLEAVADNNFCKAMNTWSEHVTIIGDDESVACVREMYSYLVFTIRGLCRNAFKKAKEERFKSFTATGTLIWQMNFYEGAVEKVTERLQRQREEDVAEADAVMVQRTALNPAVRDENGRGTALVLVKQNDLMEAIYEFYPHMRPLTPAQEAERQAQWAEERRVALEQNRIRKEEERALALARGEDPDAPKEPVKYKEYKQRGRPRGSGQSRYNSTARSLGQQAGATVRIHKEVGSGTAALNK